MNRLYKADLHVHSRHSNKPSMWALRKLNCPESFTDPLQIYKAARKKQMQFVTITDHNSISGALEIAHLPGSFISCEVTTYLPDDGCKLHVIALDISEAQYADIMHLRKNIYELAAFLRGQDIAHFLAHPLYDMNMKLSLGTLEKMLLLFDVFEVRNGARAAKYNLLVGNILSTLTEEKIAELADRHGLAPFGKTPWIKGTVGGSDDHSGFFIGRTYTVSRSAGDVHAFASSIREKKTWAGGEDGDPLVLAHSIYGVAYRFLTERFAKKRSGGFPFINALAKRVTNSGEEKASFFQKITLFIRKNLPEVYDGYEGKSFEQILDKEAKRLLNDAGFLELISTADMNRKVFAVTSRLVNRLIYIYTERLTKASAALGLVNLLNSLSTIGLVHLLASPYYVAFHHQNRSKALMRELGERFIPRNLPPGPQRIALFTDTLNEINGVAITIRRLIDTARERGIELEVITSSTGGTSLESSVMNFSPIGECALPEYPDLKLGFPPVLDVIEYCERKGFTRIHASTPGTMGLLGLLIGKLMDIPISGTYHTDIPQYVRDLSNDGFLENVAWNYMIWFYSQMEEVMVPSMSTRGQLIAKGLAAEKVKPLPRWVDTTVFAPAHKEKDFWKGRGIHGEPTLLYVGRVSKEKNLKLLAEAFKEITDEGAGSTLAIVGDGPYRKELEDELAGYNAVFTGFLSGRDLSEAYASSDIFVFPSTTDTFGNVVLEAQASGLPVIVSDSGGPKELMVDGSTGIVVKSGSRKALVDAMRSLIENGTMRKAMGANAREFTVNNGLQASQAYSTILHCCTDASEFAFFAGPPAQICTQKEM
ncbi:MAG TPA: glycosyltransferase [Thermodesulfovibrionales bacterium]|nr:glycosyltransferase [Thermodesulfovibrionales bacterium]